jgi:hypothetical protein
MPDLLCGKHASGTDRRGKWWEFAPRHADLRLSKIDGDGLMVLSTSQASGGNSLRSEGEFNKGAEDVEHEVYAIRLASVWRRCRQRPSGKRAWPAPISLAWQNPSLRSAW